MGLLDVLATSVEVADKIIKSYQGATPAQGRAPEAPPRPESVDKPVGSPEAIFWDPYAAVDALGYKEKPSALTFVTLRRMVNQMPIVQSIVKTRIDQAASFSYPQEDKYSIGYRVTLKDKKAAPTENTLREAYALENWLQTTGYIDNKQHDPRLRDSFEIFLRKIVRDSLIYDQACFEVVQDRKGRPSQFFAVDGSTIRLADSTRLSLPLTLDEARYVQIYDGSIVNEYKTEDMAFIVRNPVTDIRNQGYGFSEVEMLVTTITSLLWSWDYNQRQFSQAAMGKGIINLRGHELSNAELRNFRRQWYQMMVGVENSFRTPIIAAPEGVEYIDLQKTNRDMEFSAWFDFLIKVTCGIYGMDPMEINFKYGDAGTRHMFETSNQQKLSQSKDRGLKPLLRSIQGIISRNLIEPLDPKFCFEFVGLEALTPKEVLEIQSKAVATYKTVNEVRAEEDLPPLPQGEGDIILNVAWLQNRQGLMAPPEGMGEEAEGDEGVEAEGADTSGATEAASLNSTIESLAQKSLDPLKSNVLRKSMRVEVEI